jgi:hypothetical protein
MVNDIGYISEKFSTTVHGMIVSSLNSSPRERLFDAVMGTHTLRMGTMPRDLQEQWDDFMRNTDKVAAKGDEGTFRATADALPEEEVHRLLVIFTELFFKVESLYHKKFQ